MSAWKGVQEMKKAIAIIWALAATPLAVIEGVSILLLVLLLTINEYVADKYVDLMRPINPYLFTSQIDRIFKFLGYV